MRNIWLASTLLTGLAACMMPVGAYAQEQQSYSFDLPAQDLGDALRSVAATAGWELYASAEDVNGVSAPRLRGTFAAREAIERLLAGTRLDAQFDDGAVIIRKQQAAAVTIADKNADPAIVVTGSHLRGGSTASPTLEVSRADIANAGQVDLGEVARSIPQNFSGGQNPGVGNGAGLINTNLNSSSHLNLRGLGPDATLTLLNGHRLPYDGAFGGIDISSIPVAAVERIEIVTDGASAQYGSDAVAGVANIILRRDLRGLTTSFRMGAATGGGNFQQGTDITAGTNWRSGGLMAAYHYARNTTIYAQQRGFAASLPQTNSIYPAVRQHSLLLSGHQNFSDGVTFNIDALYNSRRSRTVGGSLGGAGLTRQIFEPSVESLAIAPGLAVELGAGWLARASLAYGRNNSRYNTEIAPPNRTATKTSGCYCNEAFNAELVLDGPLVSLPAGDLRFGFGGGYRSNSMRYTRFQNATQEGAFDVSQNSRYIFGEVELPLFSPQQALSLLHRLTVTAAARHEDYPGMGGVTTPKLGILYEPDNNVSFRASWGRSFKAPTIYQQHVGYETYLLQANDYIAGSSGTIVYASGGNPNLAPERARSWSAGFEIHPRAIEGLKINVSYFNTHYRNRVTRPIAGPISSAFSEPGYASLLDFAPSAPLLDALVAGSLYGLTNFADESYDPANVVTLIDNRNRNVAQQKIEGVDFDLRYRIRLASEQSLSLRTSATYLESEQLLTSLLPTTRLAGTIFNSPHWRARVSATWEAPRASVSVFANYIGNLVDPRFAPVSKTRPAVTIDVASRIGVTVGADNDPIFNLALTVNNLFDKKPDLIRTTGSSDTPYDSTNFSAIGRFVGITISREW